LSIGNTGRTQPIHIIVPRGAGEIVNSLLVVCGYLPYEVRIFEIPENKPIQFEKIGLNITSIPLVHHINLSWI